MHVLLIPYKYPNSYNPQSHVFFEEQAVALSRIGVDVGVLAIIPISIFQIWKQRNLKTGLFISHNNGINQFLYLYPSIPKLWRINSYLQTWIGTRIYTKYLDACGKPNLLHVHVSLGGKLALWLLKKHHVPYVVTEHYTAFTEGNMLKWQVKLAKKVFVNSKMNFAVSNEFKARLEHDYGIHFTYLPNLVDTGFFVPRPQRPKQIIRRFLNIGNLYPQKNQEMLIRAFTGEFKGQQGFSLTIAGSGHEESRLKMLAVKLGVDDQVCFFGQASREDVLRLMQKSDCFVLSSTFETFGVVVIEAMSCGLPVIATRSGGPESIIIEDRLGILCDIDETQLADALKKATTINFDSNYIRQYAVNNFSSEIIADRLKQVYFDILNKS